MDHTYLRYECADSFGLVCSTASSKVPPSNAVLALVTCRGVSAPTGRTNRLHASPNESATAAPTTVVLTVAGSYVMGFNTRTGLPCVKLGHREQLAGGVGTGRALNSDQLVCLDILSSHRDNHYNSHLEASTVLKVATGWVDGTIRIFDMSSTDFTNTSSSHLAHSLLHDEDDDAVNGGDSIFRREPLELNGHKGSPVRTIAFDAHRKHRLASGGADGTVIVWDIIAESGLYRLLGHRGAITEIQFMAMSAATMTGESTATAAKDLMATASLDGLVKIWDLAGQCCIQTLANHGGGVWTLSFSALSEERHRLVTGGSDGKVRVWNVQARSVLPTSTLEADEQTSDRAHDLTNNSDTISDDEDDNVCQFMGTLIPPPNVATSSERLTCVRYHPSGQYVGVLYDNARTIDVYSIRSSAESEKKRQRRLKRRSEKTKKRSQLQEASNDANQSKNGRKRGILDDPESSEDEEHALQADSNTLDPELLRGSDEFEYFVSVRASGKIRGFVFSSAKDKAEAGRIVCTLSTNSVEVLSFIRKTAESGTMYECVEVSALDMYGHPTGIRAVALSSDDRLACTVSKTSVKVWNVPSRSCILSTSPQRSIKGKKTKASCYGLCASFLPGNTHLVVGTREGDLLIIDVAAGDVVYMESSAHQGAIWSIDVRRPGPSDNGLSIATGSADKSVKFWDIEEQDNDAGGETRLPPTPVLVHSRTLQMQDDVLAVRYSHSVDAQKKLVFIATLDCTVKVFFDDSLKLFLNLYGHKLPVLAVDCSDDDTILATSGADKAIKVRSWVIVQ
jgi:U3 small nucleolar RNA-associated protein 12